MLAHYHLVLLLSLPHILLSAASSLSPTICARACGNCLGTLRFNDSSLAESPFSQSCKSRLALTSRYLCLDLNCGAQGRDLAIQEHNVTCQETFSISIPPFSAVANLTTEEISHLRRVEKDEVYDTNEIFHEIILPSARFFIGWYGTLDGWAYAQERHFYYGLAVAVFWAAVVAIGLANKIHSGFSRSSDIRHGLSSVVLSKDGQAWLKRNLLVPATFGYRCAQSVWWSTVLPRVQSLTILVFLIMNTVFICTGYRLVSENYFFGAKIDQFLRCFSDRTGVISFANFPIIWLFGMRNNVAIWLTGWDFGMYNNFHRWCARIGTAEAVLHTVGYIIVCFRTGGFNYFTLMFNDFYWNAGVAAMAFMAMLLPFSIYWMRRRQYELFLVLHIAMSLVLLITMLWHVSIFNGRYDGLFWIPVFIWALDRVLRFFRIFKFNTRSLSTNVLAMYDSSSDLVHLRVPVDTKGLCKPRHGSFYYLMVLDDIRCWESHPFTVIPSSTKKIQDLQPSDERTPLLPSPATSVLNTPDDEDEQFDWKSPKQHMTFLIRPYDSFTSRLRELAVESRPLRVLVEGPYGHTHTLHHYDHVVFIVGGTGVVTALSYLPLLLEESKTPQSVRLHWAVRESSFAHSVVSKYLPTSSGMDKLSLELYMSASAEQIDDGQLPSRVRRKFGRPDVFELVNSAVMRAGSESLAIVACGPDKLVDDARLATTIALKTPGNNIDYFQESFQW